MAKVLLFSGGVDCLASFVKLKGEVDTLLFVNLGHKYAWEEYRAARRLAYSLRCGDKFVSVPWLLPDGVEKDNAEIPMRNLLLVQAAAYFGDQIFVSIESGTEQNESNDRSVEFFHKLQGLYKFAGNQIQITNLVGYMTKVREVTEIVKYFGDDEASQLLKGTFSCYNPAEGEECLGCPACFRKYIALLANNIKWAERALDNPQFIDLVLSYYKRAVEQISHNLRWVEYKSIIENLATVFPYKIQLT